MTARCIPIESCDACPHRDHRGGFGNPAYVPVCRAKNRNLPYVEIPFGEGLGKVHAVQKPGIPRWCPLPALEPQTITIT